MEPDGSTQVFSDIEDYLPHHDHDEITQPIGTNDSVEAWEKIDNHDQHAITQHIDEFRTRTKLGTRLRLAYNLFIDIWNMVKNQGAENTYLYQESISQGSHRIQATVTSKNKYFLALNLWTKTGTMLMYIRDCITFEQLISEKGPERPEGHPPFDANATAVGGEYNELRTAFNDICHKWNTLVNPPQEQESYIPDGQPIVYSQGETPPDFQKNYIPNSQSSSGSLSNRSKIAVLGCLQVLGARMDRLEASLRRSVR